MVPILVTDTTGAAYSVFWIGRETGIASRRNADGLAFHGNLRRAFGSAEVGLSGTDAVDHE
jgi:hypothetical protein